MLAAVSKKRSARSVQENSKKRTRLSNKDKVALVDEYKAAVSLQRPLTHTDLAAKYGLSRPAVSSILKTFKQMTEEVRIRLSEDNAKAVFSARFPIIDNAVFSAFLEARGSSIPVTGVSLQSLAKEFANEAGLAEKFTASEGWLHNFKKRYQIKSYRISGEAGAVDKETVKYARVELEELIRGYEPNDVFNIDETGLFYNALPTATLSQERSVHGGKATKERVTLLVGANVTGTEKLKLDLIGKAKNPRVLKNIDRGSLPVYYHDQKSSWMDGKIFKSIMHRLNLHFAAANRKVLILMDNCACHGPVFDMDLTCIKVHFLPPNTTSVLQPCDQGIIQALKLNYRSRLLAMRIAELRTLKEADPSAVYMPRTLNMRQVMNLAAAAWNAVTPETINACWGTANIAPAAYISRPTDVPRAPANWAQLERQVTDFVVLSTAAPPTNSTELTQAFVDMDGSEQCREAPTREQVLADLHAFRDSAARDPASLGANDAASDGESDSDEESSDDDRRRTGLTPASAASWGRHVERFMLSRPDKFSADALRAVGIARAALEAHEASFAKKQTTLTSFFTKSQMASSSVPM